MMTRSLTPRAVVFNELKMEDSTIIHDEIKPPDPHSYGDYDLGDGTIIPKCCVISSTPIFITLYPVDLVNDKLDTAAITLPSLTRLCCARIAKEARFLEEDACTRLPFNLYPAMLREAIRNEFRKIAFTLMPTWPSKVISMIDVVPGILNHFAVLVDWKFKKDCPYYTSRGIVRLVRLFFYAVKKRLTPRLRVLDLRGMALDYLMVKFLVDEIISISRNVLLLDNYDIFIECEISNSSTIQEVINFLRTRETKIRLHITKLGLTILEENKIWPLLEQINPTELFGLKLPKVDSNDIISKTLTKFSALIALDLQIMPCQKCVVSMLAFLPQLRRLSFQSSWKNRLINIDEIPESTLRQLEHLSLLRIHREIVNEINLRHLISALPLRLTEVILPNWTVIAAHLHLWKTFLLSTAPTLKMLDLRGCFKNGAHFGTIMDYLLPAVNLVHLDLFNIRLSDESMHDHVPKLNSLPRLKRILLPMFFEEGYNDHDRTQKRCRVLERKMLIGRQNPIQIQWY